MGFVCHLCLNSWKTMRLGKPCLQMRIPSRTPLHLSWSRTRWGSSLPAWRRNIKHHFIYFLNYKNILFFPHLNKVSDFSKSLTSGCINKTVFSNTPCDRTLMSNGGFPHVKWGRRLVLALTSNYFLLRCTSVLHHSEGSFTCTTSVVFCSVPSSRGWGWCSGRSWGWCSWAWPWGYSAAPCTAGPQCGTCPSGSWMPRELSRTFLPPYPGRRCGPLPGHGAKQCCRCVSWRWRILTRSCPMHTWVIWKMKWNSWYRVSITFVGNAREFPVMNL